MRFDTDALHTNLHAHAKRGNTTYEAIVEDRMANRPAGRIADPSERGDLVACLCGGHGRENWDPSHTTEEVPPAVLVRRLIPGDQTLMRRRFTDTPEKSICKYANFS